MTLAPLTQSQRDAVTRRAGEGDAQAYLDQHITALVNGWVREDQDNYVRNLYERIRAASPETQAEIFAFAETKAPALP